MIIRRLLLWKTIGLLHAAALAVLLINHPLGGSSLLLGSSRKTRIGSVMSTSTQLFMESPQQMLGSNVTAGDRSAATTSETLASLLVLSAIAIDNDSKSKKNQTGISDDILSDADSALDQFIQQHQSATRTTTSTNISREDDDDPQYLGRCFGLTSASQ